MTNEQALENVGANMKITKVESVAVDRFLFAKIHTDEGLVGYGESGAWGFLEPSAAAIEKFGEYLTGKNPGCESVRNRFHL